MSTALLVQPADLVTVRSSQLTQKTCVSALITTDTQSSWIANNLCFLCAGLWSKHSLPKVLEEDAAIAPILQMRKLMPIKVKKGFESSFV